MIVSGASIFISFLNQSFSREVNKKQEVGQIDLRWQLHSHQKVRTRIKNALYTCIVLHIFYQYFTNGCGNQAVEHGVVREHMYEMETEASENIPMSHVAQPKKWKRIFHIKLVPHRFRLP